MRRYYYLISSLPVLELEGNQKHYSYQESLKFLKEILHPDDFGLLEYFLYLTDIKNIINILAEEKKVTPPYPFVLQPGSIEINEIQDVWTGLMSPPAFLKDFLEEYGQNIDQLSLVETEKLLLKAFYHRAFQEEDNFLEDWFRFDLRLKNTITISNSRKFDIDLKHLLLDELNEDSHTLEDFVYQSLIDELHRHHEENHPVMLEKLLDKIRWKYIDQLSSFSFFDLHAVFSWFLKLQILDRWRGDWSQDDAEKKLTELTEVTLKDFNINEFAHTKR